VIGPSTLWLTATGSGPAELGVRPMKVALFGAHGKVGAVLGPALKAEGYEVTPIDRDRPDAVAGHDVAVDFTGPDAVAANVFKAIEHGVPAIVGTTGLQPADLDAIDDAARERGLACLVAPNFAVGAVLMMRFAAQAARYLPRAEIVELHHDSKLDSPSGTAKATAALVGGEPPIHSVRLPGLVAHQEVLFGGQGQLLTIRHDSYSREAFVPGVLLALARLDELPAGLTVGLDALLD
jgi:4-hydroxy-tetrahydrodipicolinate reductase